MNNYNHLIQKMNPDFIAMAYTNDGDLGQVAHGRDSIRNFLRRFSDYKVLSQSTNTDSIAIAGDTAYQKGKYQQVTITPQKDTVHVHGEFGATWIWTRADGWRLKRMETRNG